VALAALVLAHQEWPVLTWATLNLLIATALVRVAPAGVLQRIARIWRAAGLVIVVVLFVPFALNQARLAFFPQLESPWAVPYGMAGAAADATAPAAPPPQVAMDRESAAKLMSRSALEEVRVTAGNAQPKSSRLDRDSSYLQRYASDVQLQNGPGVPRWQYQSYVLQWNGPVEPSQSLRLVVLTPAWVSLWRLLAITLLAVLLAALARGMLPPANTAWIQRWFVRFRESPGTTASVVSRTMPVRLLLLT